MKSPEKSFAIAEYEKHFNLVQAGIRGLASTWTLASFAGLSFFLKPEVARDLKYTLDLAHLSFSAYCGMGAVTIAASGGLLALWILDQLVYHRLLLSAFLVGLCIEAESAETPPVRWIMAASDRGKAVPDFVSLFYFLPLFANFLISVAIAVLTIFAARPYGWWSLVFPALHVWAISYFVRHGRDARLSTFMDKDGMTFPQELLEWFPEAKKSPRELLLRYLGTQRPIE